MRGERKKEHIEQYLRANHAGNTLLSDVYLEHNALPLLSLDQVDTSVPFLSGRIELPLMINAMTGGGEFAVEINRQLAELAKTFGIPMAVGSMMILFEERETAMESFAVVRDVLPAGHPVLANINANATPEQAQEVVSLIDASALQIHLNVAQELSMDEGDRDFRHVLDRIVAIREALDVPLFVKEVGYGLSGDVAARLADTGIRYFDVSGAGGTNFIEIEDLRGRAIDFSDLYDWGIPTAKAILDVRANVPKDATVIASGGIRSCMDIVRACVLGADLCAASGEILSYLVHGGVSQAASYLSNLQYKLKSIMLMLGAADVASLREVPHVLTGRLRELTRP